jgi:polyisoprenoid-binding protein YceI
VTVIETTGLRTGVYEFDAAHTRLGFAVRYAMITTVRGEFTEFFGDASLDVEDPTRSSVTVVIPTASIDTRQAQRDEHLRSPDFLDVDTYPEMIFRSTAIAATGPSSYRVTGDLTICSVTRTVSVDLVVTGAATDVPGHELVGFEGTGVISRKDFGLTWNTALETGGVLVGDEISLQFDISAARVRACTS